MATVPKFRIDVAVHDLMRGPQYQKPKLVEPKGLTLPEPVFPQFPELLADPGPEDAARPPSLEPRTDPAQGARLAGALCARLRTPCLVISIPSSRIFSATISATWTAGTAGPSTTK